MRKGMRMKAKAGVWLTAAAVLAVAAASWPADAATAAATAAAATAAAGMTPDDICDELDCDADDYALRAEDVLENITDLLGLNFSDISHGEDPFNNLRGLLGAVSDRNSGWGLNLTAIPLDILMMFVKVFTTQPFPPIPPFAASPRELGPLYEAAPSFINAIAPQQKPDLVEHETLEVTQNNVRVIPGGQCGWLLLHSGPLAFIVLLITTIFRMFGACSLEGHYTERPRTERRCFDRKCDGTLKRCLAIVVMATLIMYLCGLCCYYWAEQQMENGLKDTVTVVCNFTRSMVAEVQMIILRPFMTFTFLRSSQVVPGLVPTRDLKYHSFIDHWHRYHLVSFNWLYNFRGRSAVTSLSQMVGQLGDVQRDLRDMKDQGAKLCLLADQLSTELRKVRRTLRRSLASCDLQACFDLQRKHNVLELNTQVPHVQTPNVSEVLRTMSELHDQRLREEMADARRQIDHIDLKLDEERVYWIKRIDSALDIAYKLGHFYTRNLLSTIQEIFNKLEEIEKYRLKFLKEYLPLISNACLGIIFFLTNPALLLLGLPHCILGLRPKDAARLKIFSNLSRIIGSRCIYCAIWFTMVSFVVCVLGTGFFFIIAILLQRAICDPLWDPLESSVFSVVDSYVDIEKVVFKGQATGNTTFTISRIYYDILYPNATQRSIDWGSYYDRIATENRYNYMFTYKLLRYLKEMQSVPPKRLLPAPVQILSDSCKRGLRRLGQTRFSELHIDRTSSWLKADQQQFTKTSRELSSLAVSLSQTADAVVASGAGAGPLPSALRAVAAYLPELRVNFILPMLQNARALNRTLNNLQESLVFNASRKSLERAIEGYLDEVAQGEKFVNEEAHAMLRQTLKWYQMNITTWILSVYQNHTSFLVVSRILSPYIDRIRTTLCVNLLLPIHGMWLCLAFCWIILHAMLLASRNLARICLHTDPYPGPAVVRAYDAVKRHDREARKRRAAGDSAKVCGGAGCSNV